MKRRLARGLRHLFWVLLFATLGVRAETVVIYAAADRPLIEPLIRDFEASHPTIRVDYHDLQTAELYERFLKEADSENRADIVWSSAMDLQMKLVNDGYAKAYRSSETAALPPWARWKEEAFGTTFEPVCFAYNRHLLPPERVPKTHAELVRILSEQPERFRGRLATYDPHRSGLGFLLHSQDLEANPVVFWNLIRVMAKAGLSTEPTSAEMLDRIVSGKALIGYNVLCSYALTRAAGDDTIGVIMPRDYTLVMSRISFINAKAPHPDAAKAWMDYVLSRRGQGVLNQIGLHSVRDDIAGAAGSATDLRKQLGQAFRPIVINTGLLTYLDRIKRQLFLANWDEALAMRNIPPARPDRE